MANREVGPDPESLLSENNVPDFSGPTFDQESERLIAHGKDGGHVAYDKDDFNPELPKVCCSFHSPIYLSCLLLKPGEKVRK